jgi:hypothetical protein
MCEAKPDGTVYERLFDDMDGNVDADPRRYFLDHDGNRCPDRPARPIRTAAPRLSYVLTQPGKPGEEGLEFLKGKSRRLSGRRLQSRSGIGASVCGLIRRLFHFQPKRAKSCSFAFALASLGQNKFAGDAVCPGVSVFRFLLVCCSQCSFSPSS